MSVVPIVALIDEQGLVRAVLRDPQKDLPRLTAEFNEPAVSPSVPATEVDDEVRKAIHKARDLAYSAQAPRFSDAIRVVEQELAKISGDGRLHFAVGSLYRGRYDSSQRQPGDFQRAVDHWQKALDINPNQYIWRRRYQQYGPRSDKPYPFYNWVAEATREILARGDTPVDLAVEPAGAELAAPSKDVIAGAGDSLTSPDPEGRIVRDDTLINAETILVPPRVGPGQTLRMHIVFRPSATADAHWNNESDPMKVFIEPPAGWIVSERLISFAPPKQAVSDEPRTVEFELKAPPDLQAGDARLAVSAFYHVCRGTSGECLYRRRDIDIPLGPFRRKP